METESDDFVKTEAQKLIDDVFGKKFVDNSGGAATLLGGGKRALAYYSVETESDGLPLHRQH